MLEGGRGEEGGGEGRESLFQMEIHIIPSSYQNVLLFPDFAIFAVLEYARWWKGGRTWISKRHSGSPINLAINAIVLSMTNYCINRMFTKIPCIPWRLFSFVDVVDRRSSNEMQIRELRSFDFDKSDVWSIRERYNFLILPTNWILATWKFIRLNGSTQTGYDKVQVRDTIPN